MSLPMAAPAVPNAPRSPAKPGRARGGRASRGLRLNLLVLAWLVAEAVVVVVHRDLPEASWLLVHVLLLGAVSSAILVWSQHFADTLLRRPSPGGTRAHTARLVVHSVGAVCVGAGMIAGRTTMLATVLLITGAGLVVVAALWQAVSIAAQMRAALAARFAHLARYYVVAGLFLPAGVVCGVFMARAADGSELYSRLYVAHVAANVLGWVGITVAGTLMVLWPTVLHTRIQDDSAGKRALPLLAGGLLVIGLAAATGLRPVVAVGALVYLVGLGILLRELARQARSAPPATYAGWAVGASAVWFAGAVAALGVLVALSPDWSAAQERASFLVGPFAVGLAAQVLIGAMSYLLPVVLGGGPAATKAAAAELDRGGPLRLVVVNGGLALFLLPLPSAVAVTVSLAVFIALGSFGVLAARAVRASRRAAGTRSPVSDPADDDGAEVRTARRAGLAAAGVGVLAIVVALGVAADPTAAGLSAVGGGADVTATGSTTTVAVTAQDMRFTPDVIDVPYGDRLVIELTNADPDVHDLVLANGADSGRLALGETVSVDVGVVGADLDGWCSVAGHRLMGMTLEVVVTGAPSGDVVAAGTTETPEHAGPAGHDVHDGHDGAGGGAEAPSAADGIDLMAPALAGFTAHEAALAPAATGDGARPQDASSSEALADGTTLHRYRLEVTESVEEVALGVRQTMWGFGGATADGRNPVIRGQVGDTFEITLVNDGSIGHSIDFHAGALAPDGPMRTIGPGEELTYRFTATRSGIWMYHCSTMPMSLHIANGMSGAVIIDPPGLADVDREYVLVQNELYLGPVDGVADGAKIAAGEADLVVFNGYADQYRHEPLPARTGERVRFWVLDAGPNRSSSFHVVGGQFHTVFFEGDYQLKDGGSTGTGGSQALALAPAQGGFVELEMPEAGHYTFVTHTMSDAERGARGVIAVTD